MKRLSLIFLIISVTICSGCETEKVIPKTEEVIPKAECDYIIAGSTDSSNYVAFNDVISNSLGIDFNSDGQKDISVYTHYSSECAGDKWSLDALMFTLQHTEVVLDTSWVVDTRSDTLVTPLIIEEGVRIDKFSNWANHPSGGFILSKSYIIDTDNDCIQEGSFTFHGWLNNEIGFLGFRAFQEDDTIYGWIKLRVEYWQAPDPVRIYLEDLAYR